MQAEQHAVDGQGCLDLRKNGIAHELVVRTLG